MAGENGTAFGGTEIPDQTAQFLARVLAWSTAVPPDSYVNIHAFTPKANPRTEFRRKGGGRAFESMVEYPLLQQFLWQLNQAGDEAFFCLSTRSAHGGVIKGHRKATRSKALNRPVQLKSFVLDLDVKPKGYPSQRAALAAVLPFLDGLGLRPGPIIDTGWGLHVYITLPQPITPAVWQPLANALIEAAKQAGIKHDVGVTRDDDRILRLPGSFNLKDPNDPKLCRILDLGSDTPLADLEKALAPYRGKVAVKPNGHAATLDPTLFPPRAPIRGSEAVRAQTDAERFRVVTSPELLCKACGVVEDSLQRGGDGDPEPLWFELAKLCHYVEGGRDLFHQLSSGDDRYDKDQTDAKYDSVQTGGWPHCQTIADTNPETRAICEGCPHWPAKRTPINAAMYDKSDGQVNGHVNGHTLPPQMFAAPGAPPFEPIVHGWIPPGYQYTSEHMLMFNDQPVFMTPVLDVRAAYHAEGGAHAMALEFTILRGTRDTDDVGKFSIPTSAAVSPAKFNEHILKYGLIPNRNNKDHNVHLDLLTQLQMTRAAVTQQRTGWIGKDFAYGSDLYTAAGPRPSGMTSNPLLMPRGNLDDWKKAANILMGRGCIEMEIIMATGYTGPLVEMSGVSGALLHVHGETGRGKTLASEIACSVACDPRGVIRDQTINAGPQRIAAFNNIPVYFDEFVRDDSRDTKGFAQLVKNATSGSSRARLDRSGNARPIETSRNQVVGCANRRLTEVSKVATTNAQAARIVEFEISNNIQRSGLTQTDFIAVGAALKSNYGKAMQVYIDYVVRHYEAVNEAVQRTMDWLNVRLKSGHSERFWIAQLAIIFVAARLAKNLDLQRFDVAGIQKFLLDWYQQHRDKVFGIDADTDSPEFQMARLRVFYNDNLDKKLTTEHMAKQGRKKETALEEGRLGMNNLRPRELAIRVATVDRKMYVSEDKLRRWHEARGSSFEQQQQALLKSNVCVRQRKNKSIGGGTHYPTMQEPILEFDLSDPRNADFLDDPN